MNCVELNPPGNFDAWDPAKLNELKRDTRFDALGQKLLFENEMIKVWEVILYPGERLPFRKITRNYNFTSLTEGLGLSRYDSGKIEMVRLKKDDSIFVTHEGREAVYDFENIGKQILYLHALEFKPLIEKTVGLKIDSAT